MNLQYDGITNKDTGFGAANYVAPSLDSIAEVKVQASNFQAEYGRAGGANVIVVTKSGSSTFHGSAAYYKRHEALQLECLGSTADVRRCDGGGSDLFALRARTVPVRQHRVHARWTRAPPGNELQPRPRQAVLLLLARSAAAQRSVPRELHVSFRSASGTATSRRPSTTRACCVTSATRRRACPATSDTGAGGGCFPGNVIPEDRIHPMGRAMLNLLPLPDPLLVGNPVTGGQYNYQFAGDTERLRRDQVVRVDWNVRPGTTFYSRVQWGKEINARGYSGHGLIEAAAFPLAKNSYDIDTSGIVNTLVHTFGASTVLEAIVGTNWSKQDVYQLTQADSGRRRLQKGASRARAALPWCQRLNVLPDMSFGGTNALPNSAGIAFENRYPFYATNPLHNFSANLTQLRGAHNLKAGVTFERTARPARRTSDFNGVYNFNGANDNPLNANLGWANALLGNLNTYTESNTAPFAEGRFNQIEFYVQDNWRVSRRFTLDPGIRFVHMGSAYVEDQQLAYFDAATWDPAQAPLLYEPTCNNGVFPCAAANRVAKNPLTGEVLPSSWIGALVPGTGNSANGSVVADGHPPQYNAPGSGGLLASPRVGFAWDLLGDGRTAIRGGFGTTYQRYGDDQILQLVQQAPLQRDVSLQWTTIDNRINTPSRDTPLGAVALREDFTPLVVHSWSIGVQRELPFRLLGDVSYVGNRVVNQQTNLAINSPHPTEILNPSPDQIDPTTGNVLPDNFLRPVHWSRRDQRTRLDAGA